MQPCTHDFLSLTVPYMNKLHKQKALLLPLFMLWIWTFFYTHACPSSLRVHHDLFLYASIPHFHLILPHGSFSSLVLGLFFLWLFLKCFSLIWHWTAEKKSKCSQFALGLVKEAWMENMFCTGVHALLIFYVYSLFCFLLSFTLFTL